MNSTAVQNMIILPGKTNFVFQQWYAGILVTMMIIELGFQSGWVSPTLSRFMTPGSKIHLSPEQASWVASLINAGRLLGGILGAVLTNYFGSKKAIFIAIISVALGWLLISLAASVELLYIARLASGLGFGISFGTFPLFLGEIAMPQIRGTLVSLASFGSPIGQLITSIFGPYLTMSMAAFNYIGLALILMFVLFFLPESPHHLMKTGNREGARKSIEWYRAGEGVQAEFDAVARFVMCDSSKSFTEKLQEFKTPAMSKATFQIIALFTFMHLCGQVSIVYYMETILKRAKFTMIQPSDVVIYVNLVSAGITVAMVALAVYFFLLDASADVSNIKWIPETSMFLFMISFYLGLMPVPNTSLSELFPANIKRIASGISSLTLSITSFIAAKTYQPLVDVLGESYVFLFYAICTALVIPCVVFAMQETKGKSLQQIQDEIVKT